MMMKLTAFEVSTVTPSVPMHEKLTAPLVLASFAATVATSCCAKGTAPLVSSTLAGVRVMSGSGELAVKAGL